MIRGRHRLARAIVAATALLLPGGARADDAPDDRDAKIACLAKGMRRDYLVADVALGAALISAGGAVEWQIWGGRADAGAPPGPRVRLRTGPGGVVVVGAF